MAGPNLKQFDFSDYQPAFDDADDLDRELQVQERPRSGNRAYAHELLDYWLDQESQVRHWPNLSKGRVRRGMHARIDDPDLIKQGPTGLCGPAAFLRALARQDPCEFALFGGLLYSCGFANLGRRGKIFKKVEPRLGTKASPVPPDMEHTDWLILASLRDAYNAAFTYRWDWLNQAVGMTVSTMADFFRGAGYSHVVESLGGSSIFKGSVSKGIENIDKANWYFEHGYQVAILIDAEILKTAKPGPSPFANHWVGLRSVIEVNRFRGNSWTPNESERIGVNVADVWSWGETHRIPPYPQYMPFDDFVRCYYGYVAAKP
jgi:hypothetical protein